MANYHNLKNAAILTPTANQDLGSDSNRYSNVFMSGNIVMSNGVTVTSTNVITPKVSAIALPGTVTAVAPAGGETVTVTGTGFSNTGGTPSVLIGSTPASSVTYISSTSLTFTTPVLGAGTYVMYVINNDGGTATYVAGISYSGTPAWSTAAGSLGSVSTATAASFTVLATGDAPITYAVKAGSSLPSGLSLNSSTGAITGTAPTVANATTYNFTLTASDLQNQNTDRNFSITVSIAVNVEFKLWAGGGGGTAIDGYGGGSGGFVAGTLSLNPGTVLKVVVGAGGSAGVGGLGGGGGGYCGVFLASVSHANALLIAGAGSAGARSQHVGVGGGGLTGQDGFGTKGFGGTQSAGGASSGATAGTAGSALQGGKGVLGTSGGAVYGGGSDGGGDNSSGTSGGGGGGYYGGGRGAGTTTYYNYATYTNEVNATTFGSGIPTAVVNSGGGGGGGSYWAPNGGWSTGSGAGGSGRVLIRYAGSPQATGGTITQSGGYTIHQFLTSDTFAYTPVVGLTTTHQTSAYWGETITFTYLDEVADASTRAYTISGVTSEQIGGASLSGNFTFTGQRATVTVVLSPQSTNTTATMVFTSGGNTFTISLSSVTSFTSSSSGTYWGGTTTFTASTRGLTAGATVPYAITGVTSAQISNASLTGNATNVLTLPGYSASFNGTTSKLSIPASADFAFGTGSFTIEFWIKTTDVACDIITQTTASTPNWGLIIVSGSLYWQNGFAASSLYSIALSSLTSNPTSGSWTHVAITRNGSGTGNLRFWINGTGQTAHSGNDTTNYTGQGPIQISGPGSGYGFFTGNISNLRIVKGVAVYTGNFTVPTSPLTATQSSGTNISAITGTQTSLLCCQSATVIDNSAAVRTITNTAVTVSDDAPIGNTTLAAVGGGTATITVVTNPTEPILNTATMVTAITGGSQTSVIRTGNPKLIENLSPSVQSLEYIDTEVTDIHSSVLESTVNTVDTVTSITIADIIDSTLQSIEYIDTEITDVHAQTLEATVATVASIATDIIGEIERPAIAGVTPAPTFAYSSGEEIVTEEQGAATVSQIWSLS